MKYLPILSVSFVILVILFIFIGKGYITKLGSRSIDSAKLNNTYSFIYGNESYELKGVVKSVNHISRKITLVFSVNESKEVTYSKDTKVRDVQLLGADKYELSDSTIDKIKTGDIIMVLCDNISCESTKLVSIIHDQTE